MMNEDFIGEINSEVANFFGVQLLKLNIVMHDDKTSLDESLKSHNQGKEVQALPWMVGFVAKTKEINILSPSIMPGAGKLTGLQRFDKTLKHEITHVYINHINPNVPKWFNEGLALYIAGQNLYDEINVSEIGAADLKALEQKPICKDTYQIGYSFVDSIISNYGKDRLISLLKLNASDFYKSIGKMLFDIKGYKN